MYIFFLLFSVVAATAAADDDVVATELSERVDASDAREKNGVYTGRMARAHTATLILVRFVSDYTNAFNHSLTHSLSDWIIINIVHVIGSWNSSISSLFILSDGKLCAQKTKFGNGPHGALLILSVVVLVD